MIIVKIENVRVLDPIQKTDSVQTVYIQDGKLVAPVDQVEQTIDGQGKWLM
ncbi:MAG: aspartate carbamoyltransferase, partial [Acinetobacter baumannii]|nr:aspartate carbamoyltransferase [Acinetobacter baumannii]